jgi:hypothetical protein
MTTDAKPTTATDATPAPTPQHPLEDRVAARIAALTAQLAERKATDDLPRTMTTREVSTYNSATTAIIQTLAAVKAAVQRYAELDPRGVEAWRDFLVEARQTLCDEMTPIKSPIRDRAVKQRFDDLAFSIKLVDRGLGITPLGIVTLRPTRIGQLMAARGYAVEGDALRTERGWQGGLKEVEGRLSWLYDQRQRTAVELERLIMTPEERQRRLRERTAYFDLLRDLNIQLAPAGEEGFVAYTKDGDLVPRETMTPEVRAAFEQFERAARPIR